MEPPSSINSDQGNTTGPLSEDPLSKSVFTDSYFVITRPSEENSSEGYVVCIYSARTGLTYIGQAVSMNS